MSSVASPAIITMVTSVVADTVGDAGSSRLLVALVIFLVLLGLALLALAWWVARTTRYDPEALAPLELMGHREWLDADDKARMEMLAAVRPRAGATAASAGAADELSENLIVLDDDTQHTRERVKVGAASSSGERRRKKSATSGAHRDITPAEGATKTPGSEPKQVAAQQDGIRDAAAKQAAAKRDLAKQGAAARSGAQTSSGGPNGARPDGERRVRPNQGAQPGSRPRVGSAAPGMATEVIPVTGRSASPDAPPRRPLTPTGATAAAAASRPERPEHAGVPVRSAGDSGRSPSKPVASSSSNPSGRSNAAERSPESRESRSPDSLRSASGDRSSSPGASPERRRAADPASERSAVRPDADDTTAIVRPVAASDQTGDPAIPAKTKRAKRPKPKEVVAESARDRSASSEQEPDRSTPPAAAARAATKSTTSPATSPGEASPDKSSKATRKSVSAAPTEDGSAREPAREKKQKVRRSDAAQVTGKKGPDDVAPDETGLIDETTLLTVTPEVKKSRSKERAVAPAEPKLVVHEQPTLADLLFSAEQPVAERLPGLD